MPDQTEVLKYQLDITDVEAKTRRVQELTAQIGKGRAAGEDTSGLEQSLEKELGALGRLTPAMQKHAGVVETLDKNKRDLVDVISLLGGKWGGMVGDVLGSIQAFTSLGKTVAVAAGAFAALAAGFAVYSKWRDEINRTTADQKKLNDAVAEANQQRVGQRKSIADALLSHNALTPENEDAAMTLAGRLGRVYGVSESRAGSAAALGVASGITDTQDAGILAHFIATTPTANVSTPEDAARAMAAIRETPGMYGDVLSSLWATRRAQTVMDTGAEADAVSNLGGQHTPEERAFLSLKKAGQLPAGVTDFNTFRDYLGTQGPLDRWKTENPLVALTGIAPTSAVEGQARFDEAAGMRDAMRQAVAREVAREGGRVAPETGFAPLTPSAPVQEQPGRVINNYMFNNTSIGTQHVAPARKLRAHVPTDTPGGLNISAPRPTSAY